MGGARLPGTGIRKVALRRSVVTGWEGVWRSEVAVNRKGGEGHGGAGDVPDTECCVCTIQGLKRRVLVGTRTFCSRVICPRDHSLQGIFATGPLSAGPFATKTFRFRTICPKSFPPPDHSPQGLFPAGPSPQGLFPAGPFAPKIIQFRKPRTRPKYHTTVRYEPVYTHAHTHARMHTRTHTRTHAHTINWVRRVAAQQGVTSRCPAQVISNS